MELQANNQFNQTLTPNKPAPIPTSNLDYQNLDYNLLANYLSQKISRLTNDGAQFLVNGRWTSLSAVNVAAGVGVGQASYPYTTTINCGFQPKLIRIKAFQSNLSAGWSIGEKTATTERNILYEPYVGRIQNSEYIIYLVNNSGNTVGKATATITSTGFTINWQDYDSSTCHYQFEAIG